MEWIRSFEVLQSGVYLCYVLRMGSGVNDPIASFPECLIRPAGYGVTRKEVPEELPVSRWELRPGFPGTGGPLLVVSR